MENSAERVNSGTNFLRSKAQRSRSLETKM